MSLPEAGKTLEVFTLAKAATQAIVAKIPTCLLAQESELAHY